MKIQSINGHFKQTRDICMKVDGNAAYNAIQPDDVGRRFQAV